MSRSAPISNVDNILVPGSGIQVYLDHLHDRPRALVVKSELLNRYQRIVTLRFKATAIRAAAVKAVVKSG